ncbi:hypothetical protein IAT38_003530 [Cryptococcus sp. DSM 104549]
MSFMYTRRVYDTPDLMLLILEKLDKRNLCRMLTIEKALFPLVVSVLWKSVKYRVTEDVDEYTPRGMVYMAAVRHLIIDDFPDHATEPADPKLEQELITSVISNFPNISTAQRIDSSRPWAPLWTLETWRDVEEKQHRVVDLGCVWKFEEGTRLEDLEAPQSWEGYEMDLSITSKWAVNNNRLIPAPPAGVNAAHFFGAPPAGVNAAHLFGAPPAGVNAAHLFGAPPAGVNAAHLFGAGTMIHLTSHPEVRRAVNGYLKYLLDPAVRHPRICAINTDEVPVSLADLQKIALYRHEGHLPVRSFLVGALERTSLEQLEQLCEHCLGEVEELLLDGRGAGLPLRHIGRLIAALARQPKLKAIALPVSILEGNNTFTPSSAVSPPPSHRTTTPLRALQQVTLNIYMPRHMLEHPWYSFPVEEVAQHLAWLGAREGCKYVVQNKTSVFIGANVSQRLDEAVHVMQG